MQELRRVGQDYIKVDLSVDQDKLRTLGNKQGNHYSLVAGDNAAVLSRRLDCRGGVSGLTFVLAKPAPNQKTLTQLGYRVCRQGEPGKRIRFADVQAVDPK